MKSIPLLVYAVSAGLFGFAAWTVSLAVPLLGLAYLLSLLFDAEWNGSVAGHRPRMPSSGEQ